MRNPCFAGWGLSCKSKRKAALGKKQHRPTWPGLSCDTQVDLSALLKLYLNEPESRSIAAWRSKRHAPLLVTHHGRVELFKGMALAAHRKLLSNEAFEAAIAALDDETAYSLGLTPGGTKGSRKSPPEPHQRHHWRCSTGRSKCPARVRETWRNRRFQRSTGMLPLRWTFLGSDRHSCFSHARLDQPQSNPKVIPWAQPFHLPSRFRCPLNVN